jgi:hypothetical protein
MPYWTYQCGNISGGLFQGVLQSSVIFVAPIQNVPVHINSKLWYIIIFKIKQLNKLVLPLKTALDLLLIPFLDAHMAVRQLNGKNKILPSLLEKYSFPLS